jgi:hypothetical protein
MERVLPADPMMIEQPGAAEAMLDRHSDRAEVSPNPIEEKSAVAARQGLISGRVVTVLVVSLFLAVVAMAVGFWASH